MYFSYDLEPFEGKFYSFVKPILKPLSHIFYRVKYKGTENLPESGKLIIACNHIRSTDPAFIVVGSRRQVHYMAKSDLFENFFLAKLFTFMNAFPVKRLFCDRKALNYALKVLEKDYVLGIFPEGRRVYESESRMPTDARNGVGYIALLSGADVVPACLYRTENSGKLRPEQTVVFGKVIKNSELGFKGENRSQEIKNASVKIMDAIKSLWEEENCL